MGQIMISPSCTRGIWSTERTTLAVPSTTPGAWPYMYAR